MNLQSFFKSKIFTRALWGVGIVIVLLAVFMAGEFVGFRKASFSYRWGESYYKNFAGSRGGIFQNMGGRDFLTGHGTFGSIIKITTSTLLVQNRYNAEKIVLVGKDTVIRRLDETVSAVDLREGDRVAVIGSPNDAGQIEAKFIRVFPSQ